MRYITIKGKSIAAHIMSDGIMYRLNEIIGRREGYFLLKPLYNGYYELVRICDDLQIAGDVVEG